MCSTEGQAARVYISLDNIGFALAGCDHLSLRVRRRKTVMAELPLCLLLREAGCDAHQIHPTGTHTETHIFHDLLFSRVL